MARMAQVKMERVNQYVNTRYTSVCVGKGLCHVCCSKLPHPRKLHVLCHDYSIYCSTPQLDTTAICRHKVNLIPPRLKKKRRHAFHHLARRFCREGTRRIGTELRTGGVAGGARRKAVGSPAALCHAACTRPVAPPEGDGKRWHPQCKWLLQPLRVDSTDLMRKEDHTTHETEAPAETHIQKANIAIKSTLGLQMAKAPPSPGCQGSRASKGPR